MRTPEDNDREYAEDGGPVDDEAFWQGLADAEIGQRRRNVRALEMLGMSHRAYGHGLNRNARMFADAARDIAPDTVVGVFAGMMIGMVPHPGRDPAGWAEYLGAQRDGLARAEAEAGN